MYKIGNGGFMRIYDAEKKDGIDFHANKNGSSSAFLISKANIKDLDSYFSEKSIAELLKTTSIIQTVEELIGQEQPDLALVVAILVSTGWNLNDDIFLPDEVWRARKTPIHKPMNDNHDETQILGHIVDSRVLDKDGDEIELSDDESPPKEFDIEVAGVLYRAFPKLSGRINDIIKKSESGEMFVSMEAWFPDFDYGVIDQATGQTKIIERTEKTAFLTKHLRIYNGTGQYQGYKIGRVLKNIIFGAQGFVDEPANPDSVIKVAAKHDAASSNFVIAKLDDLLEGGVDDMDEKQMQELQKKLEEAQAIVKTKEDEIVSLVEKVKEFEGNDYASQIATLTTKVEELSTEMVEASSKVTSAEAEKVELQTKLDETVARAEKSEVELDEIRKTSIARDRLDKLTKVKEIEDEDATLAELRDMTEDTFAIVLKYAGEIGTKSNVDNDKADGQEEVSEQAEAVLDKAQEEEGPDFSVADTGAKSDESEWVATAKALCGRKNDETEGGE